MRRSNGTSGCPSSGFRPGSSLVTTTGRTAPWCWSVSRPPTSTASSRCRPAACETPSSGSSGACPSCPWPAPVTTENILERITFYHIDSRPIDKHLTGEERILYLKEIKADIAYFKRSYARADLQVIITGLDPEASAAAIDARLEIQQRVARGEQGNTGE
jgi:hypothetical protein